MLSRRDLLTRAGGVAGAAVLGGGAIGAITGLGSRRADRRIRSFPSVSSGSVNGFHSRPDLLPPTVATTGGPDRLGYLFLGPGSLSGFDHGPPEHGPQQGPLIVDHEGEVVWFRPLAGRRWASSFRVQRYRGAPVLTWWEGDVIHPGFGRGEGVIVDTSYREVARVRAGNGLQADLHEFLLTPEGTALITCYPTVVEKDLSTLGGPTDARALESVIQEVDVRSGRVLFEWRSLDHVPVAESYQPFAEPYDYIHVNSIDVLPDGNLLVSARATWALYKLDRRSGEIIWRLGGKHSDFGVAPDARFSWQHDARPFGGGQITLFDDGAGPEKTEPRSRGIALAVEERRRIVRLTDSYNHPHPLLSAAMGNVQVLPGGHMLVGWGAQRYASTFARDGTLIADAAIPSGLLSYRAYRFPWHASAPDAPALGTRRGKRGRPTLYASWNGATGVAHWQVHTGPDSTSLRPFGVARRLGFETAIPVATGDRYAAVTAFDHFGRELATSAPVTI